jgi:pimeloyl-ACP methyl ester carboxylesterase
MRARYPDTEGFVERDGVKVAYEVFGSGEPALVFAPTDPLVHSRAWKAQVPYLARTSRVVTIDPRGNGRSDRPESSVAYADTEFVADTVAVMDAAGVDHAVLVGICSSAWTTLLAAALHPDRVLGIVNVATWVPFLTLTDPRGTRPPHVHFLPPTFPPRKRQQRRDQGRRRIIRPEPRSARADRSAGRTRAGSPAAR